MSLKKSMSQSGVWLSAGALAASLVACGGGSNSTPLPPPPPTVQGDPLYEHQWHLHNTGQANFASEGGTPGIDLNVVSVHAAGVTGRGAKVLVVDTGLDIRHPDLAANVDAALLHNFDPDAPDVNDPTPLGTHPDLPHGTAVAGLIASVAHNGIGGRGVAPAASLGAANLEPCVACNKTAVTLDVYGGAAFSQGAHVFNASYGEEVLAPLLYDMDTNATLLALRGLTSLRAGKGAVVVKSAGNSFADSFGEDGDPPPAVNPCIPARTHGLSCQNAVFDPEAAMPQVLVIGAVNAYGVKSSYSTAGASLLVSGLGGEYGFGKPGSGLPPGPALLSTDVSGCDRGYVQSAHTSGWRNDFENPRSATGRRLNALCDYTSAMNGTSAAAPTVTGVVALMLSANPNLTWRDLRLILAKTARQVDAGIAPITLSLAKGYYVAEPGWTTNAAGLKFHNWYGYGLVDAAAAVAMAQSYTGYLPGDGLTDSGWMDAIAPSRAATGLQLAVPLQDPSGANSSVRFDAARTIEAVQVRVSIEGQGRLGDLGIELISPSGTRSVLMSAHNVFQTSTQVDGLLLASNAFNEEPAQGVWTLRVVDVNGRQAADASAQAVLAHWSLRVHGR